VLNYKVSELLFQETVEFDLPATAQAIPGFEIGANVNTRYRFKQSAKETLPLARSRSAMPTSGSI